MDARVETAYALGLQAMHSGYPLLDTRDARSARSGLADDADKGAP